MPSLMIFGDSNTYGTPPVTRRGLNARFGPDIRWASRACQDLGRSWTLVEEGLPGRTAQFNDPVMGRHMNGWLGLRIALESHGPLDVLVIMLGTNDVQTRFGASSQIVLAGIAGLLDIALSTEMQMRHGGFRILLVCPPPILESGPFAGEFVGSAETSRALAPLYESLAKARKIGFLDAGQIVEVSAVDGVHLDEAGHTKLGAAVADAVRDLMDPERNSF